MSAPNYYLDTLHELRELLRKDPDVGVVGGGMLRMVEIVPDREGFHVLHELVPAVVIVPAEETYKTWSNERHELEAKCVLQLWDVVGEARDEDFNGKKLPEWAGRFLGNAERLKRFVWKNRTRTVGTTNLWFDVNRSTEFWRMRYDALVDRRGQVFVRADVELTLHRAKVNLSN